MTIYDEAKIRREGFQISKREANALLEFINLRDKDHRLIEAEIVVKLELLAGKYHLIHGREE